MKRWKKTLCTVLSICLVFSLFTGTGFASEAAETHGALRNGALSEDTDGWDVSGGLPLTTDDNAEAGYKIADGENGARHLSIWNKSTESKTFSMTQTIANLAAGSYTARLESVGNSLTKHNLILKAHNDTTNQEVAVNINTQEWNVYVSSATAALEVSEGDTVTISISGPLEAKAAGANDGEWYGIRNVEFEAAASVQAPINVKKVPGLSEDFIHGVDVSTYLSEIQSGVTYKDENGTEKNMFEIFRDAGVNYVRLRVWNCPFRTDENGKILYVDDEGNEYNEDQVNTTQHADGYYEYALKDSGKTVYREGYGAGNCDIDAAVATGKIATSYGMKVLIDFHYSDFWADPAKMKCPKAWEGMDITQKAAALSAYTTESLQKLKAAGVDVGMVQIGNEINGGMAGEKDWSNVTKLLDAGSKAVRAVDKDILIAVHYADPHRENFQTGRAKALHDANIDYDVFATSFYSFWHGSPENLTNVLKTIAETYHKKVMVAEVSYCTTLEDGDGAANVVNASTSPLNYSIDPLGEGLAAAVRDSIAAVSAVGEAGIGTFYWEPAWVPVGNYAGAEESQKAAILASNIDKWEKYGSGWASMWSGPEGGGYDPGVSEDRSTHGSQWDNQAMFDFNGKALPAINVYKWVYTGAEGPVQVSSVDTAAYTMNYKDTPQLPGTVNVHLNDGNVVENVAVTWDAAQLEALKTADFGEYTIDGSLAQFQYSSKGETITVAAGQQKTTCAVTVTGTNYLTNGSFEEGETGWTAAGGVNLKTDGSGGNAKDGNNYYDAWAESELDFTLEQNITTPLPSGKYTLFGHYQGTNVSSVSADSGLTATVTYRNGESRTYRGEIQIPNTWKVFHQAKAADILINQNVTSIKVTSRVACSGSGPWVVVDDINLMQADPLTEEEEAIGAAIPDKKTYTVTFKDGNKVLKTETKEEGSAATAPAAPTKAGYTFDGWDTAFDRVSSNLTVNAKWKKIQTPQPKKYKVTFHVNGGKALKTKTKTVTAGKTYGTLPNAKRTGYTFNGWYTAKSGGKKITKSSKVNISKNTTLYAHWKKVARPGNVKKPSVKNTKKNTLKITFQKTKGAEGYEIRYASKSNMKGSKKVTAKKNTCTVSNKKLKKGSTYYIQVRAFKKDSTGKKIYSKSYSPKTKVKLTK